MSFGTIMLLLFVAGLSFYSKAKKSIVVENTPDSEAMEGMQDGADMPFESDLKDVFDEEPFTYESEPASAPVAPKAPAPKAPFKPRVEPTMAFATEEWVRPQFDLRQAVIAQTILTNNYINEINQQNQ